jgi:pilus assembly protein CpaB
MKPKTMILLVVAIGCGLAASYMTSKLLADRREQPPPEEKIKILVTKTKVPKGTVLKEPEKFFEIKERSKADEPKEKYFTEFAQLKDKRLKKELKAEVHVSPEDLQDRTTTTLDTPPGYGALGLRANPALLAGNQVWPGDKVDIILTQRGATKVSARTVLKDVQILAVGDRTNRESEGAPQGNTVTVALLPEDAQKVRVAETLGELSLWLHGSDEEVKHSTRVVTEDDVLRGGQGNEPKEPPVVVAQPEPDRLPLGLSLPEVEQIAAAQKKAKEPVVAEEEPPVKQPSWTLTIYPGFDPPIQQHYYDTPAGGIVRDNPDSGAATKKENKDKKDNQKTENP